MKSLDDERTSDPRWLRDWTRNLIQLIGGYLAFFINGLLLNLLSVLASAGSVNSFLMGVGPCYQATEVEAGTWIRLTEALIIPDITKTKSDNRLVIH